MIQLGSNNVCLLLAYVGFWNETSTAEEVLFRKLKENKASQLFNIRYDFFE